MCLMQTDLPVPEGPMIIEILFSGSAMFSPRRTWLRPNDLCTSTNSIASGTSLWWIVPRWNWNSSRSAPPMPPFAPSRSSSRSAVSCACCCSLMGSPADRRARVGAPEDLGAEHPDDVHKDDVEHHRLGRGPAHPYGASARVVAVVTRNEHDSRRHEHRLDEAV